MYLGDNTKLYDALVFVDNPPASEATQKNLWPFTVYISAADIGDHYIDLYSEYSRSRPYQNPQSKWSHLLPQWRFTDLNDNVIDKIKTTDTIVYDVSGNQIGVTGSAQFYYIDDMPSEDYTRPVVIWATLEVSGRPVEYDLEKSLLAGYSNSRVLKGEPYYINGQPPTYLDISSNGIVPIAYTKWINSPFRYTTVIKGSYLNDICPDVFGDIIVFDYPQVPAIDFAAQNEIHRDLINVPTSSETWSPLSAYFERYDDQDFHIGGFHIGSVESSQTSLSTNISAIVNIEHYGWFRDTPYVWISNTQFEKLHRISLPYQFQGLEYTSPLLPGIQTYSTTIDSYGTVYTSTSSIEGEEYWYDGGLQKDIFGGIHGIAVSPCLDVWGVDSEMDQLHNFSTRGRILTSINIQPSGCSPQSVVMDSKLNMWVTLYGATSTVKFDRNGNDTGYVAVPPYQITDDFTIPYNYDNIKVRPVQAETDTEDNVWVTYEHPLSSMALKYDSEGNFLASCSLPISSQPQGAIVDASDNSVWISNTYEILVDPMSWEYAASGGSIQHFSSDGVLIDTYIDIPHPSDMTIDLNGSLWFTFGYRGIGMISGGSITQYWLSADEVVPYGTPAHIEIDGSLLALNDKLKGIACDSKNRIWALDGRTSDVYVINVDDTSEYFSFPIVPQDNDMYDYSIQALGDWTGLRWNQKYLMNSLSSYSISGISDEFSINRFEDDFSIRKFNESWDATKQIREYALSDHIYENTNLFNGYLSAMVGGLSNNEDSIGRKSYERIANFVDNHVDIDTCGIDQLYSIANQLDVPIDDYNLVFPEKLKRLMNLISISHTNLWGTRCKCQSNFQPKNGLCQQCGHSHCLNRGETPININRDDIAGGEKLVFRSKHGEEKYDYLYSPSTVLSGGMLVSSYPISAAPSMSWITSGNYSEYYFYEFKPIFCDYQVEGVINWDDEYTTLSEYSSSIDEWYGENNLVDIILNYELRKGLNFNDG